MIIAAIFHEVLVEIVNLVRPSVEDFLGFLRRLTLEAQAVLLKGSEGGDELAELADCLHILRSHICNALKMCIRDRAGTSWDRPFPSS